MNRKTKPMLEPVRSSEPWQAKELKKARAAQTPGALRRAAEARLKERTATRPPEFVADPKRLQHELEVHQIELEMQNEELRQTQLELMAALECYAEFYEFSPASYLTLKPDDTILQANLAAASLLGIERARLLRQRFVGFVAAEARFAFKALLARAFATRAPQTGEVRLSLEGKPPLTIHLRAWVSTNELECRLVLTDLTEHMRAEEALRESEQRHRTILRMAMDGFWRVDMNGRLLEVNEAYCRMSGYTEPELLAMNISDLETVETSADTSTHIQRILTRGEDRFVSRHRRKDGSSYAVEVSVQYKQELGGYLVGFLRDITESQRAEEELHRLSARLLQLRDEERRRLARELHDSTVQDLAAVMVNLSFLRTVIRRLKPEVKQALLDSLSLVDKTTKGLRTLTYLLHPPLLEELGLPGVVRDLATGFACRSGIRVDLELAPEWRRMPEEIELALFRVIQESLFNILKHSGSKSACIMLKQAAEAVQLEVLDAGHGFALEDSGNAGPAPSLGVGIPGMRERLRELGGLLEVTSSSAGTIVRATLPLVPTVSGNPP